MEEFIAAALDQRKVLNAKTVSAVFGELPLGSVSLSQRQHASSLVGTAHQQLQARARGRLVGVFCNASPQTLGVPWSPGPFAAKLDRDRDGVVTVKELKDALEECNIRCLWRGQQGKHAVCAGHPGRQAQHAPGLVTCTPGWCLAAASTALDARCAAFFLLHRVTSACCTSTLFSPVSVCSVRLRPLCLLCLAASRRRLWQG